MTSVSSTWKTKWNKDPMNLSYFIH